MAELDTGNTVDIGNTIKSSDEDPKNIPFWYESPSILFRRDRLTFFFPKDGMTPYEKMNSLTRLSIYLSFFLYFYNGNVNDFFIPIITMLLFIVIYKGNKKQFDNYDIHNKEDLDSPNKDIATGSFENIGRGVLFDDNNDISPYKTLQQLREKKDLNTNITDISKICVKPTQNNPFMNVLLTDYIKDPQRGPACPSYNNPTIKKEVEKDFNYNLYQGASDIYNKRNSQREFYTTPGTTIPNDRDSLLKWAYPLPPTCKQGDGVGCLRLESNWSWHMRDVLPAPP